MIFIFIGLLFADDSKFLRKCYRDYVVAYSAKPPADIFATQKVRSRCLSKDFVSRSEDADDMLLTQDYQDSWLKHVEVQGSQVILGVGDERHCLSVVVERKKIVSVKVCDAKFLEQ